MIELASNMLIGPIVTDDYAIDLDETFLQKLKLQPSIAISCVQAL